MGANRHSFWSDEIVVAPLASPSPTCSELAGTVTRPCPLSAEPGGPFALRQPIVVVGLVDSGILFGLAGSAVDSKILFGLAGSVVDSRILFGLAGSAVDSQISSADSGANRLRLSSRFDELVVAPTPYLSSSGLGGIVTRPCPFSL